MQSKDYVTFINIKILIPYCKWNTQRINMSDFYLDRIVHNLIPATQETEARESQVLRPA